MDNVIINILYSIHAPSSSLSIYFNFDLLVTMIGLSLYFFPPASHASCQLTDWQKLVDEEGSEPAGSSRW